MRTARVVRHMGRGYLQPFDPVDPARITILFPVQAESEWQVALLTVGVHVTDRTYQRGLQRLRHAWTRVAGMSSLPLLTRVL